MMMRGDIHYIDETNKEVGSEQRAGRPAIIVSNDKGNLTSPTVEIVYLTTAPKHDLSTHVKINGLLRPSTALCEQITSVSVERIGKYAGTCSDVEMELINIALMESLALKRAPATSVTKPEAPTKAKDAERIAELESALKSALTEREMYKTMYDRIIDKVLGGRNG
jgi:mRNA interferase MazF